MSLKTHEKRRYYVVIEVAADEPEQISEALELARDQFTADEGPPFHALGIGAQYSISVETRDRWLEEEPPKLSKLRRVA